LAEWGRDAPKKLDVVMSRFALMTDAMSPQDQKKFDAFLNNMTDSQAAVVFKAVAG